MRRRFSLGWALLIVMLALAVPATTAAYNPYRYSVQRNRCTLFGGNYGNGYVQLKVKLTERGWSGATQFQTETYLQEAQQPYGDWYEYDGPWTQYSASFADDFVTWSWRSNQQYSFTDYEASTYFHRLAMHIQYWGDGLLLRDRWLYSNWC